MLKTLMTIGSLAGLLCFASLANAQGALPTATAKGALQVGGGFTLAEPDYGEKNIKGISGFADFDFRPHIGVEATVHYVALVTPTDLAEDSYLVGPRFIYPRGRLSIYGKALLGVGDLVIQETADNVGRSPGTNFAYAIGGGVDVRATRHIVVRAIDFEYQHWSYLTGLTPTVITIGAAYRFR
jgi:opacity protein-like surface antigen